MTNRISSKQIEHLEAIKLLRNQFSEIIGKIDEDEDCGDANKAEKHFQRAIDSIRLAALGRY